MLVIEMAMGSTRSAGIRKIWHVIMFITFICGFTKFFFPKTNGLLLSSKSSEAVYLGIVA